MTAAARALGAALALLATAGLAGLSDVALRAHPAEDGLLRLSWRAVGQRVEECRTLDAAEQASLPRHMRREEICEGRLAPFALDVRLDGATLVDREVRPAGAREDRPTYVFHEQRLAPGTHRLEVSFAVVADEAATSAPPLRLATTIEVPPRGVVLVTQDEDGELEVRHGAEGR